MRVTCALAVLALLLALAALPALAAGMGNQQAAARSSRMSAVSPGQMYGIVTSVNPSRDRFMISTSNRVIYVNPSTSIMSGSQRVTLSDLHTGMGVTVSARPSGRRLIASSVMLGRSAVAGAAVSQMSGVVTSVNPSANRLMISTSPRVIYVTPDTTIMHDDQQVSLSQVQTGMNVTIAGSMMGNRLMASRIDVAPTAAVAGAEQRMLQGTVSAVDAANNTFTLDSGQTIHVDASSSLTMNGQSMALSDLQPGQQVSVTVVPMGDAWHATSVQVSAAPAPPAAAPEAAPEGETMPAPESPPETAPDQSSTY